MSERRFWNEEMETLPRDKLRALQLQRLKKQLTYEYENSPYFKERFDNTGFHPSDLKDLEDLRKLPLFTKDDHRKVQEASLEKHGHPYGLHLCAPLEKVIAINATSGTTGVPTFYTFTRHDVQVNNECHARGLWRIGIRPGDTVAHAMALSMFLGGTPVIEAFQAFGCRVLPIGAEAGTERLLQFVQLCRPKMVMCTPSYAEYLITKAPSIIGKEVGELGIQILYIGGEPGGGIPEVRRRLEQAYKAKVYDDMGGCWGFWMVSCDAHEGMHVVSEDLNYIEIIDPATGKALDIEDGVIGEVAFTALDWEAAPILRYNMGDVTQILTETCACGISGIRMKVLGRADDMLIVKGINVYPAAVKNVLTTFVPRATGEMRILLDKPGPRVDPPLKMKVEYEPGLSPDEIEELRKEMESKMSGLLRFRPEIEMVPPESLGRSYHKTKLIVKSYEQKKE